MYGYSKNNKLTELHIDRVTSKEQFLEKMKEYEEKEERITKK